MIEPVLPLVSRVFCAAVACPTYRSLWAVSRPATADAPCLLVLVLMTLWQTSMHPERCLAATFPTVGCSCPA